MKSRAYLKQQIMKSLKILALSFIIISAAFYLAGSFSNAEFNISHWDDESRSIYGGVSLAVWLTSCFVMLIGGEVITTEKK